MSRFPRLKWFLLFVVIAGIITGLAFFIKYMVSGSYDNFNPRDYSIKFLQSEQDFDNYWNSDNKDGTVLYFGSSACPICRKYKDLPEKLNSQFSEQGKLHKMLRYMVHHPAEGPLNMFAKQHNGKVYGVYMTGYKAEDSNGLDVDKLKTSSWKWVIDFLSNNVKYGSGWEFENNDLKPSQGIDYRSGWPLTVFVSPKDSSGHIKINFVLGYMTKDQINSAALMFLKW